MTEKVGGIEYSIDADTDGLKKAAVDVESLTSKMNAEFDKVDATTKSLKAEFKSAGLTITKTGRVIDKLGNESKESTARLAALKNEAARLKAETAQLSKQGAQASKSVGGLGRNAGMAGIQIQQFAGQIQGGQSAMLALSQQGADLGFVLGAPMVGAMVGLGATAIGMGMAFMKTGEDVETLTEKLKELQKTELLTSEQAAFLASEEKKTIEEQLKSKEKLESALKILESRYDSFGKAVDGSSEQVKIANKALGNERKSTKDLAKSKDELGAKINKMKVDLQLVNGLIDDATENQDRYNAMLSNGANQTDDQSESIKELTSSLQKEAETIGKSERELLVYALTTKKATSEQMNQALAIHDLIKARESEIKAGRDATIEKERSEKIEQSIQKSLASKIMALENATMSQEELNIRQKLSLGINEKLPEAYQLQIDKVNELSDAQDVATKKEIENKKIISDFDKLNAGLQQGGMTELERIQADFDAKRELILEHEAILLGDKTLSNEQLVAIEQETSNALMAINEQENANRISMIEKSENVIKSLRMSAAQNAINLLDVFAGKSKAAAVAAIALNKGLALAQNTQNTLVAQTRALAELGPIAGPPAAASIGSYGAINAGLIAATGLAQAASALGGKSSSLTSSGGLPAQRTTSGSQGGGGNQDRNITIAGIDSSSLITGGQLIDTLNKALGDGYSINFA